MWMSVLRTTEDAVNLQRVPTYLTASSVPVISDTPVMDSSAQVRHSYRPFVGFARLNEMCNFDSLFSRV